MEQEMIDVCIRGIVVTTVPKSSEAYIRRHYDGKPESRLLSIVPHNYKEDPEIRTKIVQKLNPK